MFMSGNTNYLMLARQSNIPRKLAQEVTPGGQPPVGTVTTADSTASTGASSTMLDPHRGSHRAIPHKGLGTGELGGTTILLKEHPQHLHCVPIGQKNTLLLLQ